MNSSRRTGYKEIYNDISFEELWDLGVVSGDPPHFTIHSSSKDIGGRIWKTHLFDNNVTDDTPHDTLSLSHAFTSLPHRHRDINRISLTQTSQALRTSYFCRGPGHGKTKTPVSMQTARAQLLLYLTT